MTDTPVAARTVAVVAADLIFGARIRGAAEQAGVRVVFARNVEQLLQAALQADLVLLDLDTRWLDPAGHIAALKTGAPNAAPVIGFVSHVRTDVIDAARAAGADRVLARSAFVRLLPRLLAGDTGAAES